MSSFDFFENLDDVLNSIDGDTLELTSDQVEDFRTYCFYLIDNTTIQEPERTIIYNQIFEMSFDEMEDILPRLRDSQLNPIHETGNFKQSTYLKKYRL